MSILTWIEDKKRLKLLNAPKNFAQFSDSNKGLWTRCDKCGVILYIKHLKENQRVCFGCSYHLQMMSGERIENLLDKVPLKRNFDRIRDDRIRDENDGFPSDSRRDRRERDRRERDQKESQPCIAFNDGSAKKTSRISETSKVYKNTGERSHRLLVENDRSAKSSDKKRNFGFAERSSRVNEVRAESSGTRIDFRENMISTWRPLDETLSPCDPLKFADQRNYKDRLQDAQEKTGLQDAVQTGTGMIDGIPVALAVMDFSFMGGSMGSVVGEKITRLIEYATQEGLTLIIVSASGGARMQEGVFSLMQMAKISSALQIYQSCAKLLYISILTSPTTGGVTASFAMLGDIIFAEPKALIAFAGRRVIEQTLCEDLPDDFQTSEYMLHHGLVDLIVPRRFLRQALSETIRLYQKAPFKKRGRIEFGVQNPITFLTEEKIRRQWVRTMGSIDAGNALNDSSPIQSSLLCKSLLRKPSQSLLSKPSESLLRKPYLATQDKQMQSGLYPLQRSIAYDKPKMKSEDLPSWCIASAEPRRERDRRVCGANQARGGSPQVMQVVGDAPRLSHSGVKRPALYASAKYENEQYREILTSFRTMLDLFFPTADKKNFFLPISRNQTKSTDVYVQSKTLYSSPYGQALYTPARIHPQQSFRMYFNLRLKNEFYTNKNLIRRLKYSLFYFLFKKTIFLTEGSSMVRTKLRFVSKKGSKREILFADTYKAHTLLRKASERNSLCKQARGFFQESKNSTSVMQMQGNNQNGNLPSYLSRKPTFFRKNDRLEIGEGAGLQASERNSFALMRNRKGKLRQRDQGHSRCYVPIARLPFLKKVVNHKNLRGAIFSISSTAKISDFLSFRALQKNSLDKTLFYKASVPTKAKLLQSKALSKLVQSKASNSKMNDRAPKVIDQVLQNGLYAESKNSNLFYKRSICREYLTKRSSVGNRFTLDYKIKLLHVFDLYGPDLINEILQSLATHQRVIKQDFIENEKNRTRDKEEKLNKFKIEGRRSGDKQNIYQSYPDFKNQENNLSLLNQAIEMAATESVEWRAFYVDQQLSEKIGLLDDFSSPILKLINNSNEDLLNVANMIFYRLICRSKKVVEKK